MAEPMCAITRHPFRVTEREAGAIISIASVVASHPLPFTTLYSATNGQLSSFFGLLGGHLGTAVRTANLWS